MSKNNSSKNIYEYPPTKSGHKKTCKRFPIKSQELKVKNDNVKNIVKK